MKRKKKAFEKHRITFQHCTKSVTNLAEELSPHNPHQLHFIAMCVFLSDNMEIFATLAIKVNTNDTGK